MGVSARIRDNDLRAMLRLAGEAGELPPESDARRRHLLDGLCRMIGGHVAMAFVLSGRPGAGSIAAPGPVLVTGMAPQHEAALRHYLLRDPNPPDPVLVAAREMQRDPWEGVATVHREMVVEENAYRRTEHFAQFREPMDLDAQLYAALPLPDGRQLAVGICRPMRDRPFTDRDCQLVDLFHEDAGRLYGRFEAPANGSNGVQHDPVGVAGADPRLEALPPRLKPVLQQLLVGDSEKQVAVKLGLSRHTVHEYVKVLYRKLEVNSRGELLARFIGQAPMNGGTGIPACVV